MNKNSRGFAPILIVVLLGLTAVAGYFVLKSSSIQPPSEPASPTPTTYPINETGQTGQVGRDSCVMTGCNNELCLAAEQENNTSTICVYKPEYGCYETATCELQEDGECGWTQTEELISCLLEYGNDTTGYVRGDVIVAFKEGITFGQVKELLNGMGIEVSKENMLRSWSEDIFTDETELRGLDVYFKIEVEGGKEEETTAQLTKSPIVESATVNTVGTIGPP